MESINSGQETSPRQSILVLRIIWAALLAGQLVFLAIVWFLLKSGNVTPQPAMGNRLSLVSDIMVLIMVPIGWVIRRVILRPGSDGLVSAAEYSRGNIVFYAMCEAPFFVALISVLLRGVFWPHVVVALLPMMVQLANFPAGVMLRETGSTIE